MALELQSSCHSWFKLRKDQREFVHAIFHFYYNDKGFGMLVLSRKRNQEVLIGNDIRIFIVKIKGNSVSIGIKAPDKVRIMRAEIQDSFQWLPDNGHTCEKDSYPRDFEHCLGIDQIDQDLVNEIRRVPK